MYKTIGLVLCVGFVVLGLFVSGGVASNLSTTPTNAPDTDETHVPFISTPTFYPSITPPISGEPYPEPNPYPEPMTMEEFSDMIISIFGVNNGKSNQQYVPSSSSSLIRSGDRRR